MNRVLFEVSYIGNWRTYVMIILFFGIFIFLCLRLREIAGAVQNRKAKKIEKVAKIFLIVWTVMFIISLIEGYINIVIPYKNGDYIEIEGTVDYYYVYKGGDEYIILEGVAFNTSGATPWGYSALGKKDSVIAGYGQHLRIRYIPHGSDNVIVYIEQLLPEEWEGTVDEEGILVIRVNSIMIEAEKDLTITSNTRRYLLQVLLR